MGRGLYADRQVGGDRGTARYKPDDRGSGKWKIERNRLVVYDNEVLGYDIYAELKGSEDSLLFQSDNDEWGEVYTRTGK